jgi:histidinol phosphatase-like enzyme
MKIIFLDYDGVMNQANEVLVFHEPWWAKFGEEAVNNLNFILQEIGAFLVISATARGKTLGQECF